MCDNNNNNNADSDSDSDSNMASYEAPHNQRSVRLRLRVWFSSRDHHKTSTTSNNHNKIEAKLTSIVVRLVDLF